MVSPHCPDRFQWERLIRDLDLPPAVNCTAYALATYVNASQGTRAHPGLARLCQATGLSKGTVGAALAALESGGLLTRKAHGGGRGRKLAAEYDLAAGGNGAITAAETVRTVRRVFSAKTARKTSLRPVDNPGETDRKTSDRPNSNGGNCSDSTAKEFGSGAKDFGSSAPISPVPPSLPTSSNSDGDAGSGVSVEGGGSGGRKPNLDLSRDDSDPEAERRRQLAALADWQHGQAASAEPAGPIETVARAVASGSQCGICLTPLDGVTACPSRLHPADCPLITSAAAS
jgi:hypothetical protein